MEPFQERETQQPSMLPGIRPVTVPAGRDWERLSAPPVPWGDRSANSPTRAVSAVLFTLEAFTHLSRFKSRQMPGLKRVTLLRVLWFRGLHPPGGGLEAATFCCEYQTKFVVPPC